MKKQNNKILKLLILLISLVLMAYVNRDISINPTFYNIKNDTNFDVNVKLTYIDGFEATSEYPKFMNIPKSKGVVTDFAVPYIADSIYIYFDNLKVLKFKVSEFRRRFPFRLIHSDDYANIEELIFTEHHYNQATDCNGSCE